MRKFRIRIWFTDHWGITEFTGLFNSVKHCVEYYKEKGVEVCPVEVV